MAKFWVGIFVWLLLGLVWLKPWSREPQSDRPTQSRQLWEFVTRGRETIDLTFPDLWVAQVGDPVYLTGSQNQPPIGRIVRVVSPDSPEREPIWTNWVRVELYGSAPPRTPESRFLYHETPTSLEWVLQTMLPPERQREISQLIIDALDQHRDQLWSDLQPVIARALNRSQVVIQEDFRQAIRARQDRLLTVAQNYRAEFLEREVLPVIEREIWPLIQRESAPLVQEVGSEIWAEASVWRLTWRYLYDVSPLPQRDLTRKEFNRFLEDQAAPILQAHMPEFLELQRRILNEIVQSPAVEELAKSGLGRIAQDQELRVIVTEILREVLIDNPRLKSIWQETWESAEMRAIMADANERLGPTVVQIGETMFGNPRQKITPEFSDVLRSRVLFKDSRWLELRLNSGAEDGSDPQQVLWGDLDTPRPFHIPSNPR